MGKVHQAVVAGAAAVLAACAGVADGPASGARAPAPPETVGAATDPAPTPAEAAPAPPVAADATGAGEPTVTVPAPQKPLPQLADPRSPAQRMDDIKAWDQCVLGLQQRAEMDTRVNPVSDTPEEYCRKRLGMTSRTSVPASRDR